MTTPTDFVKAIFNHILITAKVQQLFCGFPGDPRHLGDWTPKTMQDGDLPRVIKKTNNNYFSLASYRLDPNGEYHADKKHVVAVHAFILDDIGTKVKAKIPLKPSWKIETSPGNFQCGLLLKVPCKDLSLYDAVVTALGESGYSDKGAKSSTRWARFPYGLNTKKEHLEDGVAPKVKLVYFYPERRYGIKQIINAFNLKIDVKARNGSDSVNDTTDNGGDSVLSGLKAAGLWKSMLETGKHDITCPWVSLHTGQTDHGTVYFAPGLDNKQAGGFKCQHGHCSTRDIVDLKDYLGISAEEPKGNSLLDTALKCVDELHVFHDENGDPFVSLDGHCLPLKSREVKAHISRKIHSAIGKALKQSTLAEVIATLESKALCEGEQIILHLRIAWYKGYIWYDLGDGSAVKVGRKGWEIEIAPPLFRRYGHQQVQNKPVTGGDPWKLFDFLNIAEDHKLETLVLLISYLVPDIAHPIFHPHGAQGSGKTTLCKMIKRLLDPSSLEVIFAPKDKQELIRQINRHHIPLFDNMSRLDSEMSDILCMACTGGGIAKRTLYTDDDDRIYNFKRCIGLNGINLLITKPDLLDRTMLLQLERIPAKKRRLESELWRKFNEAKPGILGGMFDALSRAKDNYAAVKLTEFPRLADFAKWGYAIAEALGKGLGKQFIADYQANVRRQNAEVLQSNSLCQAVTRLMKRKGPWEGTVKAAYEALYHIIEPGKTDGTFPPDAKNLRRHLERIQTQLAESERITYHFSEKPKKDGFHIIFTKSVNS